MNADMAEDVVQHVFARLWEFRSELHVGISLKNYLFTMTKNHVLNLIRNENSAISKNYEIAPFRHKLCILRCSNSGKHFFYLFISRSIHSLFILNSGHSNVFIYRSIPGWIYSALRNMRKFVLPKESGYR